MVERLFLTVPWGCLRFVIVVFPDHTHLLFLTLKCITIKNLGNNPVSMLFNIAESDKAYDKSPSP